MMWMFIAAMALISLVSGALFVYVLKSEKYKISKTEAPLRLTKSAVIYGCAAILINFFVSMFIYKSNLQNELYMYKSMSLLSVIWPVAYIDFKAYRIPNLFIIYGFSVRAVLFIFEIIFKTDTLKSSVISNVAASVIIVAVSLLCTVILKNSIGIGDIKLFALLGIFLGLEGIFGAIFFSLIVSFFIACFVLATKKKGRKDTIPFGPAIVAGTYVAVFLSFL